MKKLIIEVTDFIPPKDKEYDAAAYPGRGLFRNPVTHQWYLIVRYGGCPSDSVCLLGSGYHPPFQAEEYKEPEPQAAIATQVSGIQANDLLKAIAISQNPLLAKELLK